MKVKAAYCHENSPLMVPGVINEITISQNKCPGIKIEYDQVKMPHVLKFEYKNNKFVSSITNFKSIILDE